METKSLLYGLIGFFLGGLLVAIAATTFNKPDQENISDTNTTSNMSMDAMTTNLENKTGDEFDKAFITSMIVHHQGAVDMAKLSAKNAKHEEIKSLSSDIISAQEKEISKMKQWEIDWDYSSTMIDHNSMHK